MVELLDNAYVLALHHTDDYAGHRKIELPATNFYFDNSIKNGVNLQSYLVSDESECYMGCLPIKYSTPNNEHKAGLNSVFPSKEFVKDMLDSNDIYLVTGGGASYCMSNMLSEIIESTQKDLSIYLVSDLIYNPKETLATTLESKSAYDFMFNSGTHYGSFNGKDDVKELPIGTNIEIHEKGGSIHKIEGHKGRPTAHIYIVSSDDVSRNK